MLRRRKWDELADEDPAAGLLNLFDVWIAFAVALLLAMVSYMSVPELVNAKSDVTVIKNPGTPEMEIIEKKGVKTSLKFLKPRQKKRLLKKASKAYHRLKKLT